MNSTLRLATMGALTAGLVWWFLRGVDLAEAWRATLSARPDWIALSLAATAQTYVLRAARWRVLLEPLGRARFGNALRSTIIGFAVSFILPFRPGEFVKPYLLARAEGFSAPATFATVVIERVLDLAIMMCLFGWFLLRTSLDVGRVVRIAGGLSAAVALMGCGILALGAGHPERIARWAARVMHFLPPRIADLGAGSVRTFVQGLAVMRRPATLVKAAAVTLCLWLSIALSIWAASRAFNLTFPFESTFLIMMFLLGGVTVPTPGGIGSFQAAYKAAVVLLFGAATRDSVVFAAANALWALSVVPVQIVGLSLMTREGLTLGRLKTMSAEGNG